MNVAVMSILKFQHEKVTPVSPWPFWRVIVTDYWSV